MNVIFEGKTETGKDEWLTPPEIIGALGEFDLDPCSPINRPWDTAKKHYTILDNGLIQPWEGKVWCNPPYGKEAVKWLKRCATHGNCIALTFARTETRMFFSCVWEKATAILFIKGRLKFYHVTGEQGDSAGAPSVLIAYGLEMAERLRTCGIKGKFLWVKNLDIPRVRNSLNLRELERKLDETPNESRNIMSNEDKKEIHPYITGFCPDCWQITKHIKGICQKCDSR
jgi:hypothetical protein